MSQCEEYAPPQSVWQVYRIPIILGFFSLLFIGLSITIYIKTYQDTVPIRFSSDVTIASVAGEQTIQDAALVVDVEGAVKKPGVYRVPHDARIEDALGLAGGLTNDADMTYIGQSINRAAKLSDGAKIYIPYRSDGVSLGGERSLHDQSGGPTQITNINSASQSDLEALPSVGPVTAGKIIENRPYMRLEELIEKKAMSQSMFDKLKNQLSL